MPFLPIHSLSPREKVQCRDVMATLLLYKGTELFFHCTIKALAAFFEDTEQKIEV